MRCSEDGQMTCHFLQQYFSFIRKVIMKGSVQWASQYQIHPHHHHHEPKLAALTTWQLGCFCPVLSIKFLDLEYNIGCFWVLISVNSDMGVRQTSINVLIKDIIPSYHSHYLLQSLLSTSNKLEIEFQTVFVLNFIHFKSKNYSKYLAVWVITLKVPKKQSTKTKFISAKSTKKF